MFLVTLGYTAVFIHRHKKAGGHCMPHPPGVVENVEMKRGAVGSPARDAQFAPVQEVSPV